MIKDKKMLRVVVIFIFLVVLSLTASADTDYPKRPERNY